MEGRWAQLAIDAHIAHAIDYSRPIKGFVEAAIFDRLETKRELEILSLYPTIADGHNVYLNDQWVDNKLRKRLFTWERQAAATQSKRTIYDRIAELKRVQAETNG